MCAESFPAGHHSGGWSDHMTQDTTHTSEWCWESSDNSEASEYLIVVLGHIVWEDHISLSNGEYTHTSHHEHSCTCFSNSLHFNLEVLISSFNFTSLKESSRHLCSPQTHWGVFEVVLPLSTNLPFLWE